MINVGFVSGPLSKPQSSVRRLKSQKKHDWFIAVNTITGSAKEVTVLPFLYWFVCRVMQKQLDGFQLHLEGMWKMGQESFNFEMDLGMVFFPLGMQRQAALSII